MYTIQGATLGTAEFPDVSLNLCGTPVGVVVTTSYVTVP